MKKLLALMLAMMLALSCVSALATDAPAAPEAPSVPDMAIQTNITIAANRAFITALASLADTEGSTASADLAAAALDMADNLVFSVTYNETAVNVIAYLKETPILTADIALNADGSGLLTSSLIPSYALSISAEELQALLSSLDGGDMTKVADELTALTADYLADLNKLAEGYMAQAVINADGSIVIPLSKYQIAELYAVLLARLGQDQAMLTYLQTALDQIAQQMGGSVTVYGAMSTIYEFIADTYAEEDAQVANLSFIAEADGSQTIEMELLGAALISVNAATAQSGDTVSVTAVISKNEGGDWQAAYDAVTTGENYTDTVITAAAAALQEEGAQSVSANLTVYTGGAKYAVDLAAATTGEGTPEYSEYASLSVDIGAGAPIVTIQAKGAYAAAPEAISAEGLTVLDLAAMDDAAVETLKADMMGYGLAGLLTAAQSAMPEQVTVVLNALMGGAQQPDAATEQPAETQTLPETAPAGV